jgi:hypothetical protein
MFKQLAIAFVLLTGWGCMPPPFDFEYCKKQCDLCTINNCTDICNQLQNDHRRLNCHMESQVLEDCVINAGCTNGDECIEEYVNFLLCD